MRLRFAFALAALSAPALLSAQPTRPAPADLIVTNARVYTADEARPLAEAFAVRDGRVVFVGSRQEADALKGSATRVLDAAGRTVIPGMVDAHGHFGGLAQKLRAVDLVGTRSYDEVIARVVERAKTTPKGTWIQGRGWDQNAWGDTRFPTHEKLSAALPDHPVVLERVDGHATLVNAAGMKLADLTAATKDPTGGKVLRDAQGAPTGVLIDNATNIVERKVPAPTAAETRAAIKDAISLMHSVGLVGVHDAGASRASIDLYEQMAQAKELNLRLYVMIGDDSSALAHYLQVGPRSALYDGQVWVRSIKLYADGAMGSRGAALLEPYSDDPNNTGLLLSAPAHIRDVADRALKAGFQVNTHAIGDRGNRVVLDAYEGALKANPTADHRFRVEHAQIINYDDIPRFATLGVIPSMQASHQTSDMYWIGKRLGPTRVLGAYAWRSLINSGVIIPNGSDFPVEDVNPLISFHAAIARQDARDWPAGGWFPEQRMTREEALRSMTLWPAYAAFQEKDMGTLTPGKYADFVVLDQDIMRVPAELVLKTKVIATYVGGKSVFEARKP
jgi:predicted amidohydrolase YtcJ